MNSEAESDVERIIDDFEDGDRDLSEYTGDSKEQFTVRENPDLALSGSNVLFGTNATPYDAHGIASLPGEGLNAYPSRGDTFSCYVYHKEGNVNSGVFFGVQDTNFEEGVPSGSTPDSTYMVAYGIEEDQYLLRVEEDDSVEILDTFSGPGEAIYDQWLEYEVEWDEPITFTVYEVDSSRNRVRTVGSASASDETFSEGGVGLFVNDSGPEGTDVEIFFDYFHIRNLGRAIDEYQRAINDYIDEYVRARARSSARLYQEYGESYAATRLAYWGHRGDVDEADTSALPDDLRERLDQLFEDGIDEENAAQLYRSLEEMFGEVNPETPFDELVDTFETFLRGTADGQEHPPRVCKTSSYGSRGGDVLGSTIDDIQTGFNEVWGGTKQTVIDNAEGARNLGEDGIDTVAGFFEDRARDIDRARRGTVDWLDRTSRAITNNPEDVALEIASQQLEGFAGSVGIVRLPVLPAAAAGIALKDVIIGSIIVGGTVIGGILFESGTISRPDLEAPTIRLPSIHEVVPDLTFVSEAQPKTEEPFRPAVPGAPGGPDLLETAAELISVADEADTPLDDLLTQKLEITGLELEDLSADDIVTTDGDVPVARGSGRVTIRNPPVSPGSTPIPIRPCLIEEKIRLQAADQTRDTTVPIDSFLSLDPPEGLLCESRLNPSEVDGSALPRQLVPGESKTYEFEFEAPLDRARNYQLTITTTAKAFGFGEISRTGTFSASTEETETQGSMEVVDQGTITEGETNSVSHVPPSTAARVTYGLTYPGSDLDLALSDDAGNRVGVDYETGEFEATIPNAAGSGPDDGAGNEWIGVADAGTTYETEVVALETDGEASTYTVTETTVPALPATIETIPERLVLSASPGEQVSRPLTVSETGGFEGISSVTVESSALVERDGEEILGATVDVPSGEFTLRPAGRQAVLVVVDVPSDASTGEFTGSLTVTDSGSGDTLTRTVPVTLTVERGDEGDGSGRSVADYANEDGIVTTSGLRRAVRDWSRDEIDTELLRRVIEAWSSGEPVT